MIHSLEYQFAKYILAHLDAHALTTVERRAMHALMTAYEADTPLAPELHALTKRLMLSIADDLAAI